jgi:hypothetical protein
MLSESARMTTAHEASYRIQYPNSTPRLIKVIALDPEAARVVDELSKMRWNRAMFFSSVHLEPRPAQPVDPTSLKGWLNDIAGHAKNFVEEITSADTVVVVSTAGHDAAAAASIGEICTLRRKTLIGLVLQSQSHTDEELAYTLKGIRPYARMLVIANGTDYVSEMLAALRA